MFSMKSLINRYRHANNSANIKLLYSKSEKIFNPDILNRSILEHFPDFRALKSNIFNKLHVIC